MNFATIKRATQPLSPTGNDFNDYFQHYGGDATINAIRSSINDAKIDCRLMEKLPEPLDYELPEPLPLKHEMLPKKFSDYVFDNAKRIQVKPDFIAATLVVGLSAVISSRIKIQPKKLDTDWTICPNLWGFICAPPSRNKSSAIGVGIKPIKELEQLQNVNFEELKISFRAEKKLIELAEKQIENEAAKHIRNNKPEEAKNKLLAEYSSKEPEPPERFRILSNDSTPEALTKLLQKNNPYGVLSLRDELISLIAKLEQVDNAQERALYLEGWNGGSCFQIDRITRGDIEIKNLTISVFGGTQPVRLNDFISNNLESDGLIERFQIGVWPCDIKSWNRSNDSPPSMSYKDLMPTYQSILNYENEIIKFSPEAQPIFDDWYNNLMERVRHGSDHDTIKSHLGKYPSLMPSLALILDLMANQGKIAEISKTAAQQAIDWCEYLESHAQKIYACSTHKEYVGAITIFMRRERLQDNFSIRDIQRKKWAGLSVQKDIKEALEVLVDHRYLNCTKLETNGRPALIFNWHDSIKNQN